MKPDIHPKLNAVIFLDAATGDEIVTRSTLQSGERRILKGVEHFVVRLDVTSSSHPFYTGKLRLMDSEGRVDRFRRRYALRQKVNRNDRSDP